MLAFFTQNNTYNSILKLGTPHPECTLCQSVSHCKASCHIQWDILGYDPVCANVMDECVAACKNRDSNNIVEKNSGPWDILFFQLVTT